MCACIVLTQAGSEEAKTYAAGSLRQLSVSESHQAAIVSAGGIAALLELMRSGTKDHRAEAADALHNLSMVDDSNQIAVARGGGIETRVELVRSSSEEEKTAAATCSDDANLCRRLKRADWTQQGANAGKHLRRLIDTTSADIMCNIEGARCAGV